MTKKEQVRESKIETYLKNQIKTLGGLCYKFKSTVNGVPDQLIVYNGNMYLVEVKRPNETPRPQQVHVHNEIKKRGVTVYTVDTTDKIDEFIQTVLHAEPQKLTTKKSTESVKIKPKSVFQIN